jgi:hypothetical protein
MSRDSPAITTYPAFDNGQRKVNEGLKELGFEGALVLPLPGASTGMGGIVSMQFRRRQHMTSNGIDQRTQQRADRANPARQQRTIKIDAFAGIDDGLAIQRQMIGEFRHQDMRQ